ncbi:MAG: hypothetical protein E7438_02865 [Ruminococcaceae bacterium]|nr:hypothetical protein [Oscillospiraceae bacterium]
MKKYFAIAVAFLLSAQLLTGCGCVDTGTTGATENNPSTSTSTVRPNPTTTDPSATGTAPGTSGAIGRMLPRD